MQVVARKTLENAVLPSYLAKRRWFSGKDQKEIIPRIKGMSRIEGRGMPVGLIEVEVTGGPEPTRWLLPLAVVSEDEPMPALAQRLALARVRTGRDVKLLTDAFALPGFAVALAQSLKAGAVLPARISKGKVATVAVNEFIFKQPVSVSDLLSFYAKVERIGKTSVTVNVEVYAERNPADLQVVKVTEANLTYVAIDKDGKPRLIPTA